MLFTVNQVYFNAILGADVFSEVLSTVNATVLTACTAEGEHEVCPTALQVTFYVSISEFVDAVQIVLYFAIVFEELDDRSVQTIEFLVRFVTSGVVDAAAVEGITSGMY